MEAYFWNAEPPYNVLKYKAKDFKWKHFEKEKILELRKPVFGPVYWRVTNFGQPVKSPHTMEEIIWVSILPLTETPEFLKKQMSEMYPS